MIPKKDGQKFQVDVHSIQNGRKEFSTYYEFDCQEILEYLNQPELTTITITKSIDKQQRELLP